MATNLLPPDVAWQGGDPPALRQSDVWTAIKKLLKPLASLKLTIALFSLSIALILFGTLAQIDKDIWVVMHQYFRSLVAWVEFKIFFPRTWDVSGGFPFPGGGLLLILLSANLLAAHTVRFTSQAKGMRLVVGLGAIAAAVAFTWAVIASGNLSDGIQDSPAIVSWSMIWLAFKLGVSCLFLTGLIALFTLRWTSRLGWWILLTVTAAIGGLTAWLILIADSEPDPSAMRILWQLIEASAAGLTLLGACWIVFKKRASIVVIHAGIGLMMFNELYVYMTAVESQMQLREHESRNYTEDIRTIELAVVDPADPKQDRTVVVPKSLLQNGAVIRNDNLPFDVQVVKFFENSELVDLAPGDKNEATAGAGLDNLPVAIRPGAGTDSDSKVDISSAYVKLLKKGTHEPLGTHLVSIELTKPDVVKVDGKSYELALRFKRIYKPYMILLDETAKENYEGTDTPRSYHSIIRYVDPQAKADFRRKIWMNNPLRFGGETFYQSGFHQIGDAKFSVLSVVTNQGWMIPYVACMIVVTGLLAHFLMVLSRFVRRVSDEPTSDKDTPAEPILLDKPRRGRQLESEAPTPWSEGVAEWFPWVIVALLAAWAVSKAIPPRASTEAMNLYEFGKLPVMYEGRVKPFDTLARNALVAVSEKQSYTDDNKKVHPATQWLLDLITDPEVAYSQKVFRIDAGDLLNTLGLPIREGFRYSLAEMRDKGKFDEFRKQVGIAQGIDKRELTNSQKKLLDLASKLEMYLELRAAFTPLPLPEMPTREEIDKNPEAARKAALESFSAWHEEMAEFHARLTEKPHPLAVPSEKDSKWQPFAVAADTANLNDLMQRGEASPAVKSLKAIFAAYGKNDVKAFNKEVATYRAALDAAPPKSLDESKVEFETFFNHFEPFFYGWILYLTAFVLACLGFLAMNLGWGAPLQRASFWLIVFTLVLHTLAIAGRIYISGRPPVTSLYTAAVFIGCAAVALGIWLEVIFRLGFGNLVAGLAGFAGLFISHFLASSGDTFTVLQAVLDTQFWLATHVVCEALGYTTTFVAGLLGIIYIVLGFFTPILSQHSINNEPSRVRSAGFRRSRSLASSPTVGKQLADMIYGVVCFGLFFSFFGTVLGGLWADDSWGRFWGWDPKENGALIIVVWNALVLHARWDGMVKDRGLAVLAVGGNIAVGWSMFGVNELGAGLHSYGFTEGVVPALVVGVAVHLAFIALGCVSKKEWASFRTA